MSKKNLKQVIEKKNILSICGVYDSISAKIAEKAGFDALWASGLSICCSLGLPDLSIISMSELLNSTKVISDNSKLPVIADCDTGFGGIGNIIRTVELFESSGVSAVCFEDKVFPKVNSFLDQVPSKMLSPQHFAQKIKASVGARDSEDFLIFARIESLICGETVEQAITRAKIYADAGADAILIHSKEKTHFEIKEFMKYYKIDLPVVIVPTIYANHTINEFEELGIKMVVYANQCIRANIQSMEKVLFSIIKNGGSGHLEAEIASIEDVFSYQNLKPTMEVIKSYENC
jgi:phosphoenolpyruvate phosphomutase